MIIITLILAVCVIGLAWLGLIYFLRWIEAGDLADIVIAVIFAAASAGLLYLIFQIMQAE